MEKKQVKALEKVALGAVEIVSGALTFTGKGMAGKLLWERDLIHGARRIGAKEMFQGKKTLQEGLKQFNE